MASKKEAVSEEFSKILGGAINEMNAVSTMAYSQALRINGNQILELAQEAVIHHMTKEQILVMLVETGKNLLRGSEKLKKTLTEDQRKALAELEEKLGV